MKILVAIANFGTMNDKYLHQVIGEYRSMSHQVDIVVFSNLQKDFGQDATCLAVDMRGSDPWSLPFAHKRIMADRIDKFDLFIYSEDDTLITERNIAAFLEATTVLPENEIAGFIRYETGPDGGMHCSTIHGPYHWDAHSVVRRGQDTFAFLTNEHAAAYMLTQRQLRMAIESGGFLVGPHQEKYDLPETAATDPYTQCGFRKLICTSRIGDFLLPHLPNKYIGTIGIPGADFNAQILALEAIGNGRRKGEVLLNDKGSLHLGRWSKSYYEPSRPDLLALIPSGARTLLSYGCGRGALEGELVNTGVKVTAVPLDSVIGACVEARGIEVLHGEGDQPLSEIAHRRFDCVLVSNVLHLVANPERLVSQLANLLVPGGCILCVVPNLSDIATLWRRVKRHPAYKGIRQYEHSGTHVTSSQVVRRWFDHSDLAVQKLIPVLSSRRDWVRHLSAGLLDRLFAEEFVIVAERLGGAAALAPVKSASHVGTHSRPQPF